MVETSGSGPYAEFTRRTEGLMAQGVDGSGSPPSVVAKAILDALEARVPKTRYAVGQYAKPFLFMRVLLPDRVFDRVLRLMMRG